MAISKLKLSNGNLIPAVGLGLWKVKDEVVFNKMFAAATAAGYRHFDCAQAYGNEHFLGSNWKKSGLERKDLFLTTKILTQNISYKKTIKSFDQSLKNLQTDYVDLLLIHFPGPECIIKSKWRALEEIKKSGRAKSIGVSNYSVKHLQAMKGYAKEMPVVNQIEMHVFLQQSEMVKYCKKHGIQIEAYSPLAHGSVNDDPVIQRIADKYSKSYSQIMLRWCVQQGTIPLPKTVTPSRLSENADIFNFKLDDADLKSLKKLDRNLRTLRRSILFG